MRALRTLKPVLQQQYKVRWLALFGLVVREEQTDTSDVDLLADFHPSADMLDLSGLALFLEERLGRRVDVVPRRAPRSDCKVAQAPTRARAVTTDS